MKRKNCWEYHKCNREPGGSKVAELGVCAAAIPGKNDGINKGTYSGRFCWTVTGSFRHGGPTCTYALKVLDCLNCEFMKEVIFKEGPNFVLKPAEASKAIKQMKIEKKKKRKKAAAKKVKASN